MLKELKQNIAEPSGWMVNNMKLFLKNPTGMLIKTGEEISHLLGFGFHHVTLPV